MTPQEFYDKYLPYASQVQDTLGFNSPDIFLAQWALETAWGSSMLATNYNNLAGINYNAVACYRAVGGFAGYTSLDQFVLGYLYTINLNGYGYPEFRATKDESFDQQATALGTSGWAASHYNDGNGPGSSLLAFGSEIPSPAPEPSPAPTPEPTPVPTPAPDPTTEVDGRKVYTVQEGDNLSSIAAKFGLDLQEIEAYNPQFSGDYNLIHPGDPVYLTAPVSTPTSYDYVVKPGDTLWGIAVDHGVTLAQIEDANPQLGPDFSLIHPGNVVHIPK